MVIDNRIIEFNLLHNAIDSIDRTIELIAWRDEPNEARRFKQAILAISHGVELLLKERLRRIHPSLVWENVDKYPGLSARTVSAAAALSRLTNIGGLDFPPEDTQLIGSLRVTRNAIEHFSWSTTKQEADIIIGQALGFALEFAKVQLEYDFFGYHTKDDDTLQQLLKNNFEFAKAFRERFERKATTAGEFNLQCEFCNAQAVNPSTGACRLCGHWNPNEDGDDVPF